MRIMDTDQQMAVGQAMTQANFPADKTSEWFMPRQLSYDSYSVPGSCTNCGHRGFISASKGTTISGKYQCARCGCRTMEKCWRRERE
jgi:hypothetical protein